MFPMFNSMVKEVFKYLYHNVKKNVLQGTEEHKGHV